jgi:cellulose synthase/poly-beta-1,6-N-acetylglucosamine synthase-like glycosyltransferase
MINVWSSLGIFLYDLVNTFIILYLIFVIVFYFVLFCVSAKKLRGERGAQFVESYQDLLHSSFTAPLSIIVPAYNEEAGIIGSIRSLLSINYSQYEIIVVNDGSKDSTLEKILEEFDMIEIRHKVIRETIKTKPVRKVFVSRKYSNKLFMIDKENGGKADALNAGINLAKYPYFVSLDGDTVLDPQAFLKVMKPVLESSIGEEIIATGGTVGIANGCRIERGQIKEVSLSSHPLVVMQVIEYLRAFLMGRIGLSHYNLLLIVSGAFGVFRKDWVMECGGYKTNTVGEDMELVIRLHRMIKEKKTNARIVYIPDPVCWTEAPEDIHTLRKQRTRWHRGLYESLWNHKKLIFNPKYKGIGLIAMPYFLIIELFGPAIELVGYLCFLGGLILGKIYLQFSLVLLILMILYGSFLSVGAVLLEEWRLRKYPYVSDLTRLFFYALSETFWYRPLMTFWRFQGLLQAMRGKNLGWGEMRRKGVSQ